MNRRRLFFVALAASVPAIVVACGSGSGVGTSSSSPSVATGGGGGATTTGSGGSFFTSSSTASSGTGGSSASTSSGSILDASLMDFCDGSGGIPIPGQTECTGDIGKKVFLFAACSCGDFLANNTVDTDSFNSQNPNMPLAGGSVGVNGNYTATAATTIKGALIVSGAVATANTHDVVQDMRCGSTVNIGHPAVAESDAYIAGDVLDTNKELTVDGKLYTPIAANATKVNAVGGATIGAVSVPPPCDCASPIDIGAIVTAFKGQNDDATNGVAADALTANASMPVDLTLPCGRYFFAGIQSNSSVHLHLTGRTVIAVEGDVTSAGAFTIDLAPGAELDFFVSGNLVLSNQAAIGSTGKPSASRVYVGGSLVSLAGQLALGANFYMPKASLQANNDFEIWGSVFAKSITSANHFEVHYDEAIVTIDGCQPPDTPCGDCHDCVNPKPACGANGTCAPCNTNKDCCPPMICDGTGSCVPPPPK